MAFFPPPVSQVCFQASKYILSLSREKLYLFFFILEIILGAQCWGEVS